MSLHTDIQQSYRGTSVTEEADIPISVLTVASADLTALQLKNMWNFSLSFDWNPSFIYHHCHAGQLVSLLLHTRQLDGSILKVGKTGNRKSFTFI